MTLLPEDKKALSDLRMKKALAFLDDARANLEGGRFNTAVNRAYYAALNAVRAILILDGANPDTHEGVVTLLSLRLIKPGILPIEVVKRFKVLLSRRTDVDYGDFEATDKDDASDSIETARAILATVQSARQEMLSRLS